MCTDKVILKYLSQSFRYHPRLSNPSLFRVLQYCVEHIYGRKTALFCIDVEAWERDTKMITEIGICIYDPNEQTNAIVPSFHTYHIRPKENYHKKNGRFVPDHCDNFLGINTLVMSMNHSVIFIQQLIKKYFVDGKIPCALVGHDLKGDVRWLKTLGILFPDDVIKVDTQLIMSYLTQQKRSLSKSLALVGIPHAFLHNAGNDAYYTLLLALKLSDPEARVMFDLDSGEKFPLDIDYQKRNKNKCPEVEINDPSLIIEAIGTYSVT